MPAVVAASGAIVGAAAVGIAVAQQGDTSFDPVLPRVHDPVMAKEGRDTYAFATGPGVSILRSRDRTRWEPAGSALRPVPEWTAKLIPGNRGFFWAPDIIKLNGRWHLYYSVSTFGSNRSAIGLATNATIDPTRKDYAWKDEGVVLQSVRKDDYNAIDPNVVVDEKGRPWMSLGSFWSGLKLFELDPKSGKLARSGQKPISIARRPREDEPANAIEAPFIYRRGGWYYLFASYDYCCRGVNSTYNVRVGRARNVRGPYLDREGKSMLVGGGTPVVSPAER